MGFGGVSVFVLLLAIVIALFCFLDLPQLGFLAPFVDQVRQTARSVEDIVRQSPQDDSATSNKIFSKDKLLQHKGKYLAILGEVFDVSKGSRHYGKDGGYHFFTGIDGTRAYATGEFNEEGLIEDITGLSHSDILAIEDFNKMYHKDYTYLGKLVGHYYDSAGQATNNRHVYDNMLRAAKRNKLNKESDMKLYPACNSEFKKGSSRVWCSNKSGGISRDWIGVPRKYYQPGQNSFRCACVRTTGPPGDDPGKIKHNNRGDLDNPQFKIYGSCHPLSPTCPL